MKCGVIMLDVSTKSSLIAPANANCDPLLHITSKEQNHLIHCIEATILQKFSKSQILHRMGDEISEEMNKAITETFMKKEWDSLEDVESFLRKEKGRVVSIINAHITIAAETFLHTLLCQKCSDLSEIEHLEKEILSCNDADLLKVSQSDLDKDTSDLEAYFKRQYTKKCIERLEAKTNLGSSKSAEHKIDKICIKIFELVHAMKSYFIKINGDSPRKIHATILDYEVEDYLKYILKNIQNIKRSVKNISQFESNDTDRFVDLNQYKQLIKSLQIEFRQLIKILSPSDEIDEFLSNKEMSGAATLLGGVFNKASPRKMNLSPRSCEELLKLSKLINQIFEELV